MERFKQKLQAAAIPFRENEPLAAHCTFKIGGPAQLFVMPETSSSSAVQLRFAKSWLSAITCWATAATSCLRTKAFPAW